MIEYPRRQGRNTRTPSIALSARDYRLSMNISNRARNPADNEGLRSLLVYRLLDTWKVVLRRSNQREDRVSLYCERCLRWQALPDGSKDLPTEWQCARCERWFRIELAVYEEIEDLDDDDDDDHDDDDDVEDLDDIEDLDA